jgi:hypothetical protein
MKHLYRILPVLAALFILHTGAEKKGSFDITEFANENPAVAFEDVQKKGSFDITESAGFELQKKGSFDLTIFGGKDPEIPA